MCDVGGPRCAADTWKTLSKTQLDLYKLEKQVDPETPDQALDQRLTTARDRAHHARDLYDSSPEGIEMLARSAAMPTARDQWEETMHRLRAGVDRRAAETAGQLARQGKPAKPGFQMDVGTLPGEDGEATRMRRLRIVDVHLPDHETAQALHDSGRPVFPVYELALGQEHRFRQTLDAAKAVHPFGNAVDVYRSYKGLSCYLSQDGQSGFALTAGPGPTDHEVVSVFSVSSQRRRTACLLHTAVRRGGYRLDCYDVELPRLYAAAGYREQARLRWDDDYAPEGWDHQRFARYNDGRPDVVFMRYGAPAPDSTRYVQTYDDGLGSTLSRGQDHD